MSKGKKNRNKYANVYLQEHDLDIFVWFYHLQLVAFRMGTLLCIEISFSLFAVVALPDDGKYKICWLCLDGSPPRDAHSINSICLFVLFSALVLSLALCLYYAQKKNFVFFVCCCCCLAIVANCYEINNLTLLPVLFHSSPFLFNDLNF